ncbi:MAG: AAA family ATPase [Verrucomicrobiota bacterium]
MNQPLNLTISQKRAAERLDFFWRIKRGGIGRLGSTETRPLPLLIGPSGAGKTASVRDFAARHDLPIFSISAATWIVRGARNEGYTSDALAVWVGEHGGEGGVIFIDEINKLRAQHMDASWSMSTLIEVMAILDCDSRLLRMGFKQEQIDALGSKFLIIGAGAWQETWTDSKPQACAGFGGSQGGGATDPNVFLSAVRDQNVIPEELLFRFNDRLILIEPPAPDEIAARIAAIRSDVGVARLTEEQIATLAAEASESQSAMRWLEAYALDVIAELPREWHDDMDAKVKLEVEDWSAAKPRADLYPKLYNSSFDIVRRLSYDIALAARNLASRIRAEGLNAASTQEKCDFLDELAGIAYTFTLSTIDDLSRRKLFEALCISVPEVSNKLAVFSTNPIMDRVAETTRDAAHTLATLTFRFAIESVSIRLLMHDQQKLVEAKIIDHEDARVLWFRK